MKPRKLRKIAKIFVVALTSATLFLSACHGATDTARANSSAIIEAAEAQARQAYQTYLNQGGTLTFEEWLTSIKGEDGKTPYIGNNGNWWVGDMILALPQRAKMVFLLL